MKQLTVKHLGKLGLLGATSVVLNIVQFLAIFSPFPIALAAQNYGRKLGYGIGVLMAIALFFAGQAYPAYLQGHWFIYSFFLVLSVMVSEVMLQKRDPFRGMVLFGLSFIFATLGLSFLYIALNDVPVREMIVEFITKQAQSLEQQAGDLSSEQGRAVQTLLSKPEQFADIILKNFTSFYFGAVILTLWINLLLLLRSHQFSGILGRYQYTERSLLTIKMPEKAVWLLIPSLVAAIWGQDLGLSAEQNSIVTQIGMTGMSCLGVFYFLQGLGIYIDFLNSMSLWPFFRLFLLVFTVMTAHWILALLGLFDLWVDWRRFFKKSSQS